MKNSGTDIKARKTSGKVSHTEEFKVFCILSDERVYRSGSPAVFSSVMNQAGINGAYVPLRVEPDRIGEAVKSLMVLNIAGANVTVPYKEAVMPHLDILSEGAQIIGAVNTITREADKLKGYNTNAIGFMDSLENARVSVTGKPALVFGTGGAARAVVFMLNWLRAEPVFITGRNHEKVLSIVDRIGGAPVKWAELPETSVRANLVVNATSVSGYDESPELAETVGKLKLKDCELLIDLNYGRSNNFWQDLAEKKGVRFLDGLMALACQVRRSLALWTGLEIETEAFLRAAQELVTPESTVKP